MKYKKRKAEAERSDLGGTGTNLVRQYSTSSPESPESSASSPESPESSGSLQVEVQDFESKGGSPGRTPANQRNTRSAERTKTTFD